MDRARLLLPLVVLLCWALLPSGAYAQVDPELATGGNADVGQAPSGPSAPPRVFATVGGGSSLRLVQNLDFDQSLFAPAFLDAFGAWVFGGTGRFHHGVGLGLSTNLTGDGSASVGIDPFTQFVIMPSYLLYLPIGNDPVPPFVTYLKAGVPITVTPDFSPGLQLSIGGAWMALAGLGLYVEGTASGWLGGQDSQGHAVTIHPILSIAFGVTINYEVLP